MLSDTFYTVSLRKLVLTFLHAVTSFQDVVGIIPVVKKAFTERLIATILDGSMILPASCSENLTISDLEILVEILAAIVGNVTSFDDRRFFASIQCRSFIFRRFYARCLPCRQEKAIDCSPFEIFFRCCSKVDNMTFSNLLSY